MTDPQQRIGNVTLLVRAYDEAIAYFRDVLGFTLAYDRDMERWVLMAPPGSRETQLRLAEATTPEQIARTGDQVAGRVVLVLHTDDFWRDFAAYKARGVVFCEEPRREDYGTVAVFQDLCGNRWDLLELNG